MTTPPTSRRDRRAALRARAGTVLTTAFRRWAYGVAAAAVGVAAFARWIPVEAVPVIAPLLMALFFVGADGEPR